MPRDERSRRYRNLIYPFAISREFSRKSRGVKGWTMQLEVKVEIAKPPEFVWSVLADVEHWPYWTDSVTSVERLEQEAFGVGSRVRIRQPRLKTMVWRVTEFEPGRFFAWEARTAGLITLAGHDIKRNDRGSTVILTVKQTGLLAPLLGLFVGSVTRQYMETEAQGLKQWCEAPLYDT